MNLDAVDAAIDAYLRPSHVALTPALRQQQEWLTELRALVRAQRPHAFIYDDDTSETHVEFGLQLLEHGLFRLPFEFVAYRFPAKAVDGSPFTAIILASQQAAGSEKWWRFTTFALGREGANAPAMLGSAGEFDGVERASDGTLGLRLGALPPTNLARSQAAAMGTAMENALAVIGLTATLMSKEVERTSEVASPKLNAARKRKGKLPLLDTEFIKLRVVNGAEGGDYRHPGLRKSPRMHWRRGHIRRLSNGECIPIAPTQVGVHKEAEPASKTYLVYNRSLEQGR